MSCHHVQVDVPNPTPVPAPAPAPPSVTCAGSFSCLVNYATMDADGTSFPKVSSKDAGTSSLFTTFPFSRLLKTSQSLSQQAVCALAVQGSTLNSWNVVVSTAHSVLWMHSCSAVCSIPIRLESCAGNTAHSCSLTVFPTPAPHAGHGTRMGPGLPQQCRRHGRGVRNTCDASRKHAILFAA